MATIDLTKDNFSEILGNNELVLAEFFAPWCGHCRQFTPKFKKVSEQFPDVVFGMVNTEQNSSLSKDWNVMGIPTVIAFKDGEEIWRGSGSITEETLAKVISDAGC